MEVFKPIKVENYQFVKNGLNQYEPVLVYFKDDEEEGKVYFVKNKFDDKLEEWMEENLKVEEGFREIELKNRDKNDLVGRIREINRTGQRYRLSLYED